MKELNLNVNKSKIYFWSLFDFTEFMLANSEHYEYFMILAGGAIYVTCNILNLNRTELIMDIDTVDKL